MTSRRLKRALFHVNGTVAVFSVLTVFYGATLDAPLWTFVVNGAVGAFAALQAYKLAR